MKGTIVKCLKELVEKKFGKDQWSEICAKSDFSQTFISLSVDIEDSKVMALLKNTCSTLGISMSQAADAFGDYWVNDYAPNIYKSVYNKYKSAREFILGMDDVHIMITKTVPKAAPPRFTYNFINEKTLMVSYKSSRGLVDIYMGLVRGLGRYFNEKLVVTKIDNKTVKIVF